jgi:hypothetical protein
VQVAPLVLLSSAIITSSKVLQMIGCCINETMVQHSSYNLVTFSSSCCLDNGEIICWLT